MKKETVTFAVFTDLHIEIMHDGARRLETFLNAAQEANVDFIIHLGDFCYPKDNFCCQCSVDKMPINLQRSKEHSTKQEKEVLLAQYAAFPKPAYHMLGNHEMDFCTKSDAMALYGMEKSYYSFRCGGWHFIVLDGNHYRDENGVVVDYAYGKYFETKDLPYLGNTQLEWLKHELESGLEPTVLLCHQPMLEGPRGLRDAKELHTIIQFARTRGKQVRLCMNGHLHQDQLQRKAGVVYYTLNSISNHWVGLEYEMQRYSKSIEENFPNLRFTLPYQNPLFAIITLDETGMRVRGVRGRFVQPGPRHMGISPTPTAGIKDRDLSWCEQDYSES